MVKSLRKVDFSHPTGYVHIQTYEGTIFENDKE